MAHTKPCRLGFPDIPVSQFNHVDNDADFNYLLEADLELHPDIVKRKRRKSEIQRKGRDLCRQRERFYSFLPVTRAHLRLYTLFKRAVMWRPEYSHMLRRFCTPSRRGVIQSNADSRRVQYSLTDWFLHKRRYYKHYGPVIDAVDEIGGFLRRAYPDCTPSSWSVLESLSECSMQLPHRDYTSDALARMSSVVETAYAAIISVADGGSLRIFSSATDAHDVVLDEGDIIVFRADVVHAGTASQLGHFARLHAYLDSSTVLHDNQSELVDLETLSLREMEPNVTLG